MTAAGPWSVKGIDPKAREVAKDLARRSGMTLGEWLNQVIIEGGGEPDAPPIQSGAPEPGERRRMLDELYQEAAASRRLPEGVHGTTSHGPDEFHGDPGRHAEEAELSRVTRALEALSSRMETAEHRSTLAISGIDQSVLGVLSRLDELDRDQSGLAERFEGAVEDVRDTQAKVAERVRRMEQEDGSRVAALRALEAALGRLASQMREGDERADTVAGQIRQDVDGLVQRVHRVESAADAAPIAYADAERTREDLDSLTRRMNRVELAADTAPNIYAAAGQTRQDMDGLGRRVSRVETVADLAATREEVDDVAQRVGKVESFAETIPNVYAVAERTRGELDVLAHRVGKVETAADAAPSLFAPANLTREELDGLSRRVNRVEAATDSAPSLYAPSVQTRDELDGLVRRVVRVEAVTESAPDTYADAERTRAELDLMARRMVRVEAATESAPNVYAAAGQTREDLDGLVRRVVRVEAAADTAPITYADYGQTRDEFEKFARRMTRVEAVAEAAPTSFAPATQTRDDIEMIVRRIVRVESATDAATATFADAGQTREEMEAMARRVARVEGAVDAAPSAYADAEKVETVLSRIAERLERAEARTTAAVNSLETSFAGLDARIRTTESRLGRDGHTGAEFERRFQTLASELSQKVEASRTELAHRLRTAADGRLESLETTLRTLTGQVEQSEKRSAQAIDRIGREVVNIAHSIGERVSAVETSSSGAVEQMSGEMARIAETIDGRLRHSDTVQAEALEKLGGEIARIAEKLTERISTSERRSGEALDDVTDRVARLTDQLGQRQEQASSELTDRIRQSEERTAQLLEETREKLDSQLGEVQRRASAEAALKSAEPPPVVAPPWPPSPAWEPEPATQQPAAPDASSIRAAVSTLRKIGVAEATALDPVTPNAPSPVTSSPVAPGPVAPGPVTPGPVAHGPVAHGPTASVDPFEIAAEPATRGASPRAALDPFEHLASRFVSEPPALHSNADFEDYEAGPQPEVGLGSEPGHDAAFADHAPEHGDSESDAFANQGSGEPAPSVQGLRSQESGQHESGPHEYGHYQPDHQELGPRGADRHEADDPLASDLALHARIHDDNDFTDSPAATQTSAGFPVHDFVPAPQVGAGHSSTRDMIQAARTAARRAAGAREPGPAATVSRPDSVPVPPLETVGPSSKPFGITFPGRKKKEASTTLRTVILASGWAVAITTAAWGAYSLGHGGSPPENDQPQIAKASSPPTAEQSGPEQISSGQGAPGQAPTGQGGPDLAVALAPSLGSDANTPPKDSTAAAPSDPTTLESARGLYDTAARTLERGDASGAEDLRHAANLGYAPAQFYLGRLYEAGSGGMKKDMIEARRWTERAARGGEPAAMYNFASYLYSGEGGSKDTTQAAVWFKRAADRGVVNSQYNLAQLYEKGYGVPQNAAEAYKWYLVAAASGDAEARTSADALRRRLSIDAQKTAERSAATLHTQIGGAMQTATALSPPLPSSAGTAIR